MRFLAKNSYRVRDFLKDNADLDFDDVGEDDCLVTYQYDCFKGFSKKSETNDLDSSIELAFNRLVQNIFLNNQWRDDEKKVS